MLTAASLVVALAFAGSATAQATKEKVVQSQPMEAVVTVTDIDHAARTVTVRGPKGNERTIAVPPEAQNLDQVQTGSRFKVRYLEEVAVAVSKGGGEPSASAGETIKLAPKGGTPGGAAVRTVSISGVVEAIDPATRRITLRGPKGGSRTMTVAEDVKLDALAPGDQIALTYTQAIATQMASTPQPVTDPAPAP
jgi:Cu/Ag efflux protein CusF